VSEQSKALIKRTKEFAHCCVKLALKLPKNNLGWHLQKQLIRASTSVAANYGAACLAQSKPSFIAKISISLEECDESCFWLEFIMDENLLKQDEVKTLLKEGEELRAIFIASRNTSRRSSSKKF
jgi:four helix bundle protein